VAVFWLGVHGGRRFVTPRIGAKNPLMAPLGGCRCLIRPVGSMYPIIRKFSCRNGVLTDKANTKPVRLDHEVEGKFDTKSCT
jgi:hypothetical protein